MAWKISGHLRGIGLPEPTGDHPVGCVDLMHQFEGDDHGGLLVRLFYPANLGPTSPSSLWPAQFALWTPDSHYTKGILDAERAPASWLLSTILNAVLGSPRIPAVYDASLLGNPTKKPEGGPPQSQSHRASWYKRENNGDREGTVVLDDPPPTGGGEKEGGAEAGFADVPVVASSEGSKPPEQFPVIVFSHGLKAMRCTYSGICCDLASHGYVVASVEHRDLSPCATLRRVPTPNSSPEQPQFQDQWVDYHHIPDTGAEFPLRDTAQCEFRNEQVKQRSRDAILALELLTKLNEGVDIRNMMEGNFDFSQFQARLDVGKAAIMGHSFGGATTIQALSEDQRFLCGIGLDSWMLPIHSDLLETGVQQPLLLINSSHFQWPDNVRRMMKLTCPPEHTGASSCTLVTLKGTHHQNQSDLPFTLPDFMLERVKSNEAQFPSQLDRNTAYALNMELCHAFLRRHLLKDPSYLEPVPNLDGGEGHSEHILFGTNLDLSAPSEDGPTQPPPEDGSGGSQDDPSGNEPPMVEQPHPPASADREIDRNDLSESGTPPQELGQNDAKRDRQDFETDPQLQENHD